MSLVRTCTAFVVSVSCSAFGTSHLSSQPTAGLQSKAASSAPPFTHTLPALHGDRLKMSLVEVTYAPGESSPPHSHPCPVVGHVIEGSVRMRVQGEPEKTFGVGDSFYEAPDGVHVVSANASRTRPAKFIAFFVCDHDAPLSTRVPRDSARDRR
jgi:quercetin dioxygenase-like cupin family protein